MNGEQIYGFYQPREAPSLADDSPVRLPRVLGKDELEEYHHLPINADNEIRLIELLPPKKKPLDGPSDDFIYCKIHTALILQPPDYEALSYSWGSVDRNLPISVLSDNSVEEAFFGTRQLMMALRRLRHPATSRMLWIDQLCINQKDPDEKGPQIQLMKDIYRKAKRAVVWLGEDPGAYMPPNQNWRADSALLADMIRAFAQAPTHTPADDVELARRYVDVRPTYHMNTIQQHGLRVVLEVLKRPWFRRAWVFEEPASRTNS
jgi:hypothetical protein